MCVCTAKELLADGSVGLMITRQFVLVVHSRIFPVNRDILVLILDKVRRWIGMSVSECQCRWPCSYVCTTSKL